MFTYFIIYIEHAKGYGLSQLTVISDILWGANGYCGGEQLHNTILMHRHLLCYFRFIGFNPKNYEKKVMWRWNQMFVSVVVCCYVDFGLQMTSIKSIQSSSVFKILDERLWTSTIFCCNLCSNNLIYESSILKNSWDLLSLLLL